MLLGGALDFIEKFRLLFSVQEARLPYLASRG